MDLQPDGSLLPGGTVLYSGLMAQQLGWKVRVVTSGRSTTAIARCLSGADLAVKPSERDTTFENVYIDGQRRQRVLARAQPLGMEDIPPSWLTSDVIHLAPIAQEVSLDLAADLTASLTVATPQGWMRRIGPDGQIDFTFLPRASELLSRLVVVMSLDDLDGSWSLARQYGAMARTLVVTLGRDGALLFEGGRERHVPPVPAREIDPTGAGDVFAAAFFCKLWEGVPTWEAALFAACAAALCVSGRGPDSVPPGQRVNALYRTVRAAWI
jgi:sugar/nucleoside kinase (ribokinase family)